MGENTRTTSLNDLPGIPVIPEMHIFWLYWYIIGILAKIGKTTFSSKTGTPSSSFQKRHGQNDRRMRGNISCLFVTNLVYYCKHHSNLHFRRGPPYLSIYCLINSFFHEQLLWQSVLIFSCMQALGSSGISQFLFHEIARSWHTHTPNDPPRRVSMTEQVPARVMETFVEFSINMFENLAFWTKCG